MGVEGNGEEARGGDIWIYELNVFFSSSGVQKDQNNVIKKRFYAISQFRLTPLQLLPGSIGME